MVPVEPTLFVHRGIARIQLSERDNLEICSQIGRISKTCSCCVQVGGWTLAASNGVHPSDRIGSPTRSPSPTSPSLSQPSSFDRIRIIKILRLHGVVFPNLIIFQRSRNPTGTCTESSFDEESTDWSSTSSQDAIPVALIRRNDQRMLFNELRALVAGRGCPYIVEFIGAFSENSNVAVATRLTQYSDLYSALASRREPFPLSTAISISLQILAGTAYLHAQGIIHRDIKPENILVMSDTCEKVCLADFNFAIAEEDPELQSQRCGTLGYCAPEVIGIKARSDMRAMNLGRTEITSKLDCWSVGSTIFDLVVGTTLCRDDLGEPLEVINESIDVEHGDKRSEIVIRLGKRSRRKWKVEVKSERVSQVIVGLLERTPVRRLTANAAIQLLNGGL